MSRTVLAVLGALTVAAVPATASAQAPAASFAQLSGQQGCLLAEGFVAYEYSEEAPKDCAPTRALLNPVQLVPAPDGGQVAVVGEGDDVAGTNGVAVLTRDAQSGALSFGSCVTDDGGDGRVGSTGACDDSDALAGASSLAFSPDGRFAYVSARRSDSVSWYARDPATGRLTLAGCAKRPVGLVDRCALVGGLDGATDLVISRDGATVYVAAWRSGTVRVFDRDATTGALTARSCASETGSDGACTRVTGLARVSSLGIGPGGSDLYAASSDTGALVMLGVDPVTGDLSAQDCVVPTAPAGGPCHSAPLLAQGIFDMAVSPDGGDVIVATEASGGDTEDAGTLLVFRRGGRRLDQIQCLQNAGPSGDDVIDPDEGSTAPAAGCDGAKALGYYDPTVGVAISADGRGVFAVSDDSLAAFTRDAATGKLSQFACAQSSATYKSCAPARGLSGASAVAASADARNVYVAAYAGDVVTFGASVAIASRAAIARAGRISVRLECPAARREGCAGRLSGARYRVHGGASATVAVRLPARVRSALRARRSTRMTVVAREARLGPVAGRIVVRRT